MNWFRDAGRILLGCLALLLAQMIAGMVVHITMQPPPHAMEWLLLTDFVIAVTLGVVAVRSDWSGWKLSIALIAIPLVIYVANLIEGTVFLKHSAMQWGALFLHLLLTYALVLPLWRYIFGQSKAVSTHYSPLQQKAAGSIAWRFAISDVSYLILYYTAGMIIFPYVRDFYVTQTLPSAGTIVTLQLLLRGPVFVAICLLLVRMIGLPRLTGALAVGLAFTLLSGVVPLLMPNPYFPDAVRWVHFGEVTSSNFVFGTIVGLLWGRRNLLSAPLTMRQAT